VTGFDTAPLRPADRDEVTRVWRECEQRDLGEPMFTQEDFAAFTQRPSFDFGAYSVAVREGDSIVALAVALGDDVYAAVLPGHRGRGIGAWLVEWSEEAVRATGRHSVGQTVVDTNGDAVALLAARGYEPQWASWTLEILLEGEPPAPAPPAGYALRDLVPGGADARAAHAVIERAFGEWPGHEPLPYADWEADVIRRPGFQPQNVMLAVRGDEVVGAAVLIADPDEGWVDQLAVAREHRRRGLAQALLRHAFAATWRRGVRRCGLGTDSRTGARRLYEHVGMHVKVSFTHYSRRL
jgi:GNAT superfamily N-acetyltransferase